VVDDREVAVRRAPMTSVLRRRRALTAAPAAP